MREAKSGRERGVNTGALVTIGFSRTKFQGGIKMESKGMVILRVQFKGLVMGINYKYECYIG